MSIARLPFALLLVAALSGCNVLDRLSEVGETPKLSPSSNPTQDPAYQPVTMPMPAAQAMPSNPNSLWRTGAREFFKDSRAKEVGDILTVQVQIADNANLSNETVRTRANADSSTLGSFLGLESQITKLLPRAAANDVGAAGNTSLTNLTSKLSNDGKGTAVRNETINLSIAAVITQILPNGNFAIVGRQEVVVNAELRELRISGVIRPEDITSQNTISHSQIAEARIEYGGRGQLSDMQQPRYADQIYDILFPW